MNMNRRSQSLCFLFRGTWSSQSDFIPLWIKARFCTLLSSPLFPWSALAFHSRYLSHASAFMFFLLSCFVLVASGFWDQSWTDLTKENHLLLSLQSCWYQHLNASDDKETEIHAYSASELAWSSHKPSESWHWKHSITSIFLYALCSSFHPYQTPNLYVAF